MKKLKLDLISTFKFTCVCVCVSVYSGAGRLPSLPARLLSGDRHLLLQTSRRFPQLDRHLPAPRLSLLQGINTTRSLLSQCVSVDVC